MRRAGVKFSKPLLEGMAKVMIEDSDYPIYNNRFYLSETSFIDMITPARISDFTDPFNIVYRRHKGNKQMSDEKTRFIEESVACHLGDLKRGFDSGQLQEDNMYNMDESRFVVDSDDGKTLDFTGSTQVKYRKLVPGREGITMCVFLKGRAYFVPYPDFQERQV